MGVWSVDDLEYMEDDDILKDSGLKRAVARRILKNLTRGEKDSKSEEKKTPSPAKWNPDTWLNSQLNKKSIDAEDKPSVDKKEATRGMTLPSQAVEGALANAGKVKDAAFAAKPAYDAEPTRGLTLKASDVIGPEVAKWNPQSKKVEIPSNGTWNPDAFMKAFVKRFVTMDGAPVANFVPGDVKGLRVLEFKKLVEERWLAAKRPIVPAAQQHLTLHGEVLKDEDPMPDLVRCDTVVLEATQAVCEAISGAVVTYVLPTAGWIDLDVVRKQVWDARGWPIHEQRILNKHTLVDSARVEAETAQLVVVWSPDPVRTNLRCFHPQGNFGTLVREKFKEIGVQRNKSGTGKVYACNWQEEVVDVKKFKKEELQPWSFAVRDDRNEHVEQKDTRVPEDLRLTELGVHLELRRLEEELSKLKEDARCPHLQRMRHIFADDSETWLLLEADDGKDLFEVLMEKVSQKDHLQVEEASGYTLQLMQALHYLHSRGIAHTNVALEVLKKQRVSSGVFLTDLSTAVRSHSLKDRAYRYFALRGFQAYRAPEGWIPHKTHYLADLPETALPEEICLARVGCYLNQVLAPDPIVDRRNCTVELMGYEACPFDVFAGGVTFFILLAGSNPWRAAQLPDGHFRYMYQQGWDEQLLRAVGRTDLTAEIKTLLPLMLQLDPTQRPSAESVVAVLEKAAHKKTPSSPRESAPVGAAASDLLARSWAEKRKNGPSLEKAESDAAVHTVQR
eukprot:TRINITY_DN20675_c0_g1_i1.p1 TRINITY_DN20675_c0_g1~~TRINITY_DN20675_c0_g1_i1.p1  ORF type:complete len:842 (+),score=193.00 TRINITY_DN20675_c0_g1_i1:333-2528(+)